MKKLRYISLLLIGILTLNQSCEEFLDEDPYSDVTDNMLGYDESANDTVKYKTAEQAEAILAAAYSDYSNEFYQLDQYIYNEGQSDNSYAGESKAQTTSIDNFTLDASNGNVSRDWKYMYSQIAKCNGVIQWVPQITDPALTNQRKNEIVGEAKTIRAKCYFNLVRMYGDVPLVLKEVPSITNANLLEIWPLLYPERKPVADVYNQIILDLNEALTAVKDYSSNKAIVSKALVNATLAEVYATKQPVDWAKVKQYASVVTGDSRYGLYNNYDDNFAVAADGSANLNEHGKESIFEIDLTAWATGGNWGYQMFYGKDWKKFNTPSKDLVKLFQDEKDSVRFKSSIKWEDVSGVWTDVYWPASNYPFAYKMRLNEKGNIVMLRLPAVMLLQAEAENELGNLEAARLLVDLVRNRAKMNGTAAVSKDAMRLAIEKERRLELAFEGYRWWDLKRTGRAIQVMNSAKDIHNTYNVTERKLIWPVPQSERDQNEKLTQNPGY